ncbi:MAG: hypothetical protein A3C61_01170 [Candidatus Yanofskybacteria bacterium RIFCSPHIGHO2_02_FULL_39_10]|uniref:Uncharacterized protein n=1 Tax=Candidatus Yanofskybacteria bacterium RIFCSPHIGHO2_02_FULL_39_10 TaxID=1802674 RepID=A0A1F8FAA1_9BACT|nr:MAG: hypothetical protein A3C61_01170 [Candidatus Yanofskybacteria bacterium RIFCSPHIGHO2_02_FULL_39_10]
MSTFIFNHRVYYVSSSDDGTVLIALNVKIDGNDYINWFDTVKDRIMKIGKIIDDNSEHFVFQRSDSQAKGVYTFVPMTLNLYNEKVKSKVLIPQDFSSEEQMLKAFEETKNNAW